MPCYPGRPREFTHQRRRELIDHIGQGATVEEAAQIVGVTLRTVQREAKSNEFFHHDLQLALHAAPADSEKLVRRAARTHWRAAAWLLERTDPDRFAKRPPNSCSPETLMDISNWLIESALEATPPEHRSAVYGRMRAVADKALDVVMPDQHDARRAMIGELPHRPMPLSDYEVVNQLLVVDACPAPALDLPENSKGSLPAAPAAKAPSAEASDGGPGADPATIIPEATSVPDPIAYCRANPPQNPPPGRPRDCVAGFRLQDSDMMDAAWRYPLPDEDEEDVGDAETGAPGRSPSPPAAPAAETTRAADSREPDVGSPERGNYVAKNERGAIRVPRPRPRGYAGPHGDEGDAMAHQT
jgi:hypothetical protein